MRNLKKVLALALATVMLLGMMAMASAADFTDEALIADEYDVAVDVMQAIGVFNGSKGYLNPKSTLTRAEAAKIITYLALTKANADKLGAAEAPFADVEADNWAAGSIAYAKNLEIVSGRGGNNYEPQGTLTGYELGKMLLVVLGYQANTYKGTGWDTNVNLDAMNAGLLKGLNIDLGAAILREEAAQMAFNALTAQCVMFTGGTVLETGDTKITVGAVKTELTDANYESYYGEKDGKLQLCEKLYPTLKLTDTEDSFGYATKTWKYGTGANNTVAVAKAATVLATFEGNLNTVTTEKALYAAVGVEKNFAVYVNGADASATLIADADDTTAVSTAAYKGVKVEFVKEGTATYQALVTYAYPAKVTAVTPATETTKRSVDMTIYAPAGDVAAVTYTTDSYAVGDWLLVYPKGDAAATTVAATFEKDGANELKKVEAAQTVYGTLTQTTGAVTAATSLYLDGQEIKVAATNDVGTVALGTKYTVVLQNGYAVDVATDAPTAATMDNVYYIDKIAANATTSTTAYGASSYYEASAIKMDGTVVTIKLADNYTCSADAVFQLVDAGTKDGVFQAGECTAVLDGTYNATTLPFFSKDVAGSAVALKATDKAITVDSVKGYFTANSKMMFISGKGTAKVSAEVVAAPMATTLPVGAQVIYSTNATAGVKEVAMIIVTAAKTEDNAAMFYVVNTKVGEVRIGTTNYELVNVYDTATGAKQTVAVADATAVSGLATYTVASNGVYTFASLTGTAASNQKTITSATVSLYNGMMNAGANVVDATYADAVIINTASTTALTADSIKGKTISGVAYVVNGALKVLVVTAIA